MDTGYRLSTIVLHKLSLLKLPQSSSHPATLTAVSQDSDSQSQGCWGWAGAPHFIGHQHKETFTKATPATMVVLLGTDQPGLLCVLGHNETAGLNVLTLI